MSPSFLKTQVTSMQWSFGARAGTGSSFHYHTSSCTLLLYGVKHWFFLPPNRARMSNNVLLANTNTNASNTEHTPYSFVQYPGDLVYVPDRCAHRTEIGAWTMGVTFETVTSGRPMEPYMVDYVELVDFVENEAEL